MTRPFFASPSLLASIALAALTVVGCDDGTPPMDPDAGDMLDAGPPDSGYDAGPPLSCTDITRVEPTMGATESVMFDTSMTATRPRDLGVACGNTDPELRWAPQEVLEIVVPGSGPMQVEVDTAFPETDFSFNTVLQFRTSCETVPTSIFPPSCFNDQSADEVRARGAVTVEGGSTVYVIVTGFSEPPAETMQVDEGPVRVDVTVTPNQRPTVTDGALLLAADDVIVTATGSDPEGDPRGVVVNFYDAAGALIDIYGDGEATLEGDAFVIPFDPAPMEVDYTGQGIVLGTQVNLAGFVRAVMIPRVGFRVYDGGWAISDMLMVDVGEAEEVGFGEACGGEQICRAEMRCVDAICEGTPGATRACGMATAFPDIAVTADTAASETVRGTIGAGRGDFAPIGSCTSEMGSVGDETIYTLTIPDGTFDLLLTTDLPGTGDTDTIVYVREVCEDSGTEVGCNDDLEPRMLQSEIEAFNLAGGTYSIFVERFGGLASGSLPFELQVTLRPVLEAGMACDDAGEANRCRVGRCSAGMCP